MIFQSNYTNPIVVETKEKAAYVLINFCEYCNKDAIERLHCSGKDSMNCNIVKEQIIKAFTNN